MLHRLEAAAEDVGVDGGEVGFAFLELARTDCEEVSGGELSGDVGHKEGGKSNIKGKDRFNAMSHEEGGVSS